MYVAHKSRAIYYGTPPWIISCYIASDPWVNKCLFFPQICKFTFKSYIYALMSVNGKSEHLANVNTGVSCPFQILLNFVSNLGAIGYFHVLASRSISSLPKLEKGGKNTIIVIVFYYAALCTGCFTEYALRPCIDAEINPIRHLIKFPFINKGIEFISLPSIFLKSLKTNQYLIWSRLFRNIEFPILCHKYNKTIRSTTFNFNKMISDDRDLNIMTSAPVMI